MAKIKISKKTLIITSVTLVIIIAINLIVSSIIKEKLTSLLLKNESEYYNDRVESVSFKLIQRSITLNNVFLTANKESIDSLINKTSSKEALESITLSSIKFKGIGLFDVLFRKKINVNAIVLNDLFIHKFENTEIVEKKSTQKEEKKPFDIDSIYLKKLNGLEIDQIIFNNFKYQVYDFAENKVTFQTKPISFKSSGIKLEKVSDHLFQLKPAKKEFEIRGIDLDFEYAQFDFAIDKISFNFEEKYIDIQELSFKPKIDKFEFADSLEFTKDIPDIDLKDLKIYNFSLSKILKGEGVFIDSIEIDGLNLLLFKDKRKPFDTNKRPGLPHTGLKRMKLPLRIQKVKILNSNVKLEQRVDEDRDILMEIPITNLNAEITNITSIKKYRENPLKVNATAKLMGVGNAKIHVTFPLKDYQNTFYFNGSLGASKMSFYDSALYPTLGLKVLSGDIDNLTFSASANEIESTGKMTLLYHDLEAEVFKSKSTKENKFLSWTANTLIHKSNPKKKKTPREVVMKFKRVEYKGLGNYFWKTLQGGIIGTIAPGGKQTDASKERRRNRKKK